MLLPLHVCVLSPPDVRARACVCVSVAEELKKNGAESFPLPSAADDSPPTTPQAKGESSYAHDPATLERAQAMVDSAK